MAVIHLSSEEFADRIEEMLDLTNRGDKVLIHYAGHLFTVIPVSEEEMANLAGKGIELDEKAGQ